MEEQKSGEKSGLSFEEWLKSIRTSTKGMEFKIRDCWGVYQAYKAIRKNGWYDIGRPLTEHEFYSIIRCMNALMADEIAMGQTVRFPHGMGKIELRKYHLGVSIDSEGKLRNTYPIDWRNTLLLWYEDDDAYRRKTLLRNESPWMYHIKYNKWNANYDNKMFYQFYPNTFVKRNLSKNIKQGKVDTIYG